MAGLDVEICAQECLGKTGATQGDIVDLVDRQEALGNNVHLSGCLRICTLFRQNFPEDSTAGIRISGATTQGVELRDEPALAGRNSDGKLAVIPINPPAGEG